MKGIIRSVLEWCKTKNKSLEVAQRYLRIKHRIKISLDTLSKRFKRNM
tara:strand:+ start:637 stop:780 length:144 start_codon:yes stop_codon:yes gene_type:complete